MTSSSHTFFPVQAHLPFAVVGSVEEVKVGNKTVRARQYPWGVVQGEILLHVNSLSTKFFLQNFMK